MSEIDRAQPLAQTTIGYISIDAVADALGLPTPADALELYSQLRELRHMRQRLAGALTTLEEHMRPAVEHTLTAWVAGPSVRAGVTLARGGGVEVYDGTLADALISLAREVQQ